MKDLEMKKNVLSEIMDLMDSREGDRLKAHPKLAVAKVEVEKPEIEEESPLEEKTETPEVEASEGESSEITPEQIQALLEKLQDLK